MNGLPKGFTARPSSIEDVDAIAAMVNDYTTRVMGEGVFTKEQLRSYMTSPGFSPAASSQLVFSSSDELAGVAFVFDLADPHVSITGLGFVRLQDQGKGIGRALHSWIGPRARQAVPRAPEGARVFVSQTVFDADQPAMQLLEQLGYQQTRHFWGMAVDLDQVSATPEWPDGITLCNVDLRENLEGPLRAANEAFRDHYGHVDGDFEQQLERMRHRLANDPDYSPEWSFLAMDGEDIAGVCICTPKSGIDYTTGYVQSLGVLRPWRKRGLGLALLLQAFDVFKQGGKHRGFLHVDAQSLTGATRLYEKAGMQVDQLSHEYQLELRPGTDLSTK